MKLNMTESDYFTIARLMLMMGRTVKMMASQRPGITVEPDKEPVEEFFDEITDNEKNPDASDSTISFLIHRLLKQEEDCKKRQRTNFKVSTIWEPVEQNLSCVAILETGLRPDGAENFKGIEWTEVCRGENRGLQKSFWSESAARAVLILRMTELIIPNEKKDAA